VRNLARTISEGKAFDLMPWQGEVVHRCETLDESSL
jgi:hypothetical protein